MNKEQTPIESLIIDLKIMARIPDNYTLPMIIKIIEREYLPKEQQYAQAKVLEALEREVPKAYDSGWKCCLMGDKFEGWDIEHTMETRKKSYYETEVKPLYK